MPRRIATEKNVDDPVCDGEFPQELMDVILTIVDGASDRPRFKQIAVDLHG